MGKGSLTLPIETESLCDFLPHRPPMIWIDRVLSPSESAGICELVTKRNALYMNRESAVSPWAYIEFMAQAFGYTSALRAKELNRPAPTEAFLVAVQNYRAPAIKIGDSTRLLVQVTLDHQVGEFSLVSGKILGEHESLLCSAQLKLFAR